MIKLFTRAPDNPSTGSPAYAQSVLRFYYQYFLSGMVEIQPKPEQHLVILISEGAPLGGYYLEGGKYCSFNPEQVSQFWTSGEASIRSVNLPREGVRVAKEAIEWWPSKREEKLVGRPPNEHLDKWKAEAADGLLHLVWERSEAFLTLRAGKALMSETLYVNPVEVAAGASNFRLIQNQQGVREAEFYPSRIDSAAFQQQTLRLALVSWGSGVLNRYLQLVGRNLVSALAGEVNGLMRSRSWYIQISGDSLSDSHVFPTLNSMRDAYTLLMRAMSTHMLKVIGENLTQAVLHETYKKLEVRDQFALEQHTLVSKK